RAAGAGPGLPRPVRLQRRPPAHDEPLRAGRSLRARALPRDRRPHRAAGRGRRARRRGGRRMGRRPRHPRVSLRRRRRPRPGAGRRALRRPGAGEPRHRPRDHHPGPGRAPRGADRLPRPPGVRRHQAERPAPTLGGRLTGQARLRLRGRGRPARGTDADDRLVPRPANGGDGPVTPVTLVVLTLNEIDGVTAIIPKLPTHCLDEILVVDGGSTDGTLEFFASRGVRVVRQERRARGGARISDTINGYRAITRAAFRRLAPDADGYAIEFQMSIRALQLGLRVLEIPTQEAPRIGRGVSKLNAIPVGLRFFALLVR